MDLLTAIHSRQSIPRVRPDPIPRSLIETLLDAAVQAPNHHRNRPWRFVVLSGAARERLGQIMATTYRSRFPDAAESAVDVESRKPLRAPVLIAVGVDQPDSPKIVEIENVCAAAAAVENLLLAARDLGLGAMWRTGAAAEDPAVKAFLGFAPDQRIIAFIYIGYPEDEPPATSRPGFEDRTTWMEE